VGVKLRPVGHVAGTPLGGLGRRCVRVRDALQGRFAPRLDGHGSEHRRPVLDSRNCRIRCRNSPGGTGCDQVRGPANGVRCHTHVTSGVSRARGHLRRSRMNLASVLSAAAATAAALLSGLNLVVSGRREDRKWARDAAVEALVAFLDASFIIGASCRKVVKLRDHGGESDEIEELREQVTAAHEVQMRNLTRLRVLSTGEVVAAAYELHEVADEVIDLSLDGADGDLGGAQERMSQARARMVSASREALNLRDAQGTTLPPM
jgi:hypothetical protein